MSFLGYTHPSVSATNQLYNIVAIPSGVYRYWREGRMLWPLTRIVVAGTLPGVFLGAFVRVSWLPDVKNFKLFAAAVLLYIGGRMGFALLAGGKTDAAGKGRIESGEGATVQVNHFSLGRLEYTFAGQRHSPPFWGVFALSCVVGVVGGIYGIGGGAIIAPFLVSVFGLPIHTVAGAALMGTCVTSVAGVLFYQALAPFYPHMSVAPDWLLGLLFGLGGMAGMYLGARCQKFVPALAIKWLLCLILLFVAGKYALEFFR
jgi:hypothetical protein